MRNQKFKKYKGFSFFITLVQISLGYIGYLVVALQVKNPPHFHLFLNFLQNKRGGGGGQCSIEYDGKR